MAELKSNIGRDVIEVTLPDPSRLEEVREILRLVTSNQPRMDHSNRRACATTTDGASGLSAVIDRLKYTSIPVDEIGLRRPTLDEVFLTLTGGHADALATMGAGEIGAR